MSLVHQSNLIQDRSEMLQKSRHFFNTRNILEVDCCALMPRAPIDSNVEIISASITEKEVGFFHSSPEYAMKRLLAAGLGDLYYLGHVFRKNDLGRLHNPEFTMVEWYRKGFSFSQMICETCEFLSLFFGPQHIEKIPYYKAFSQYVGIDYESSSLEELQEKAKLHSECDTSLWDWDTCAHFLLTRDIEPNLGKNIFSVLIDYPPSEAALAQVVEKNGKMVAKRFEIYHKGIELANGYLELANPIELKNRFEEENMRRSRLGKEPYLLDEAFLSSLSSLPDCCGVSVGFDRALMLKKQARSIHEVLPFSWRFHLCTIGT